MAHAQKTYFIRVPEDMYEEIKNHAENQKRSINMQAQILLGAALNRNLIYPDQKKQSAADVGKFLKNPQ